MKSRTTLALALFCHAVIAQATTQPQDPGQKTVIMVRTEAAPVIDGKLDEAVWENAAMIDDLHQVRPIEYSEPYEHTEIYLLYDDDALYVSARLYDSDPENITANILRQTDFITQEDYFFVHLDPINNRRSGYFFGVNPNGVRQDGLYKNVSQFFDAWNGIFEAQAGRFEGGWIAEIAIPYKTLSLDPNTDTWGLNFTRGLSRRNELEAWVSRNRQYDPSTSGLAIGFENVDQGLGLDLVPSLSVNKNRTFSPMGSESDAEPSLDVAYKLTPALNASVTLNTDFSATEVDDRQVNLTRFSLFFPEKRTFFLREADIFEFGNIGGRSDSVSVSRASRESGQPFFSRRIGLSSTGQPVDLDYGAKISGRVGRWELGALSIRQDDFGTVKADNLTVVRAKVSVLGESSVGVIVTDGDPRSNFDNSVEGLDFLYRNTRLPGGRALEAQAWYQASETDGIDHDDHAAGIGFRIPSTTGFRGGASVKEFQANFNPALGFTDRVGIRDYTFDVGYTHRSRDGYFQSILTALDGQRIKYIDGGLQSEALGFRPFVLTNRTGDSLKAVYRNQKEILLQPFEISAGIVLPTGAYSFDDWGLELNTGNHRGVVGKLNYTNGDFYSGRRTNILAEVTWRPSARLRTHVSYDYNQVRIPEGDFETRLVRLGLDIAFSSTLSLVNLIQYDNVTERAGINMRLHWIPQAGREAFFVVNHDLQDFDRDNSFDSAAADLTAKINYTLRF